MADEARLHDWPRSLIGADRFGKKFKFAPLRLANRPTFTTCGRIEPAKKAIEIKHVKNKRSKLINYTSKNKTNHQLNNKYFNQKSKTKTNPPSK